MTIKTLSNPLTNSESFVLAAALRYAFGLHTYALGLVGDELIRNLPRMDEQQIKSYIREFETRVGVDRDIYGEPDSIETEELRRIRRTLEEALTRDQR